MLSYQKEKLLISSYAQPNQLRSVYEYFITWLFFILNSFLLLRLMDSNIFFILPFTLLQGLIIIRIFMLQHDCGHYALFKSRTVNNMAGMICSLVTPLTYHFWRDTHAIHHKENGNLSKRPWIGNITVLMPDEYKKLTPKQQKTYAATRNGLLLISVGWIFHFYNYRISPPKQHQDKVLTRKNLISIHLTNAAQLILFISVAAFISTKYLFLALIIPLIISYCMGIFIFYIQHNFQDSIFETEAEIAANRSEAFMRSSLEGSSCFLLPPVLRWFSANIGYHHIHHVSPKIPFYKLKKIYDTHHELQAAYKVTIKNSPQQFSYKLYDPERKKMITWADLDF